MTTKPPLHAGSNHSPSIKTLLSSLLPSFLEKADSLRASGLLGRDTDRTRDVRLEVRCRSGHEGARWKEARAGHLPMMLGSRRCGKEGERFQKQGRSRAMGMKSLKDSARPLDPVLLFLEIYPKEVISKADSNGGGRRLLRIVYNWKER